MTSIASLLSARNTQLLSADVDMEQVFAQFEVAKRLWEDYALFSSLRLAIETDRKFRPRSRESKRLVQFLLDTGLIEQIHSEKFRYSDLDAAKFLGTRGNYWLENLAFFAMMESGADETLLRQRVTWVVDGVSGTNEIDVIGRRGNVLSFVSCKAFAPKIRNTRLGKKNLWNAVMEAAYWDSHFADGDGRAVFLVSTDLVDEIAGQARFPTVTARAKVLDVDVMGLDIRAWHNLVDAFKGHW